MTGVHPTPEFVYALEAALLRSERTDLVTWLQSDYFPIIEQVIAKWDSLLPSRLNPYRRTLIATHPPETNEPRYYYSVRALLRPDGVIELEDITIDWEFTVVEDPD